MINLASADRISILDTVAQGRNWLISNSFVIGSTTLLAVSNILWLWLTAVALVLKVEICEIR